MFDRYCLETLSPIYRNTSAFAVSLSVTHPLIPSQEGKYHTQTSHYQTENSISKLPSQEGQGVCDACALLPKTKAVTQNLTDTTSPNNSKNSSSPAAPLSVTHPLIPSQEGKQTTPPLISNKKNISKLPVPERGNRYYNIPVFIFSTRYTGYTPRGYVGFSRQFLAGRLWCPI